MQKQLENDELFTLAYREATQHGRRVGRTNGGRRTIAAILLRVTRASLSAFGDSSLALRLPAILGFWLMCLCLFAFVANRSSVLHGTVAMLFVLTTGAYYYAFERGPTVWCLAFAVWRWCAGSHWRRGLGARGPLWSG